MTLNTLKEFCRRKSYSDHAYEVVIVMPDDPTAISAVQGVRFNEEQKTMEVLVA
jgi:hypothetical protein